MLLVDFWYRISSLLVVYCYYWLSFSLVISLTGYNVWDYEFILHYDLLFDGWNFCPQDNVGDYREVEWLQLPVTGTGVWHIHWRSKQIGSPPTVSTCWYGSHVYNLAHWRLFCDDMASLLNSLEEKISGSVIFLPTAKDMWDTVKVMYVDEKNPSRVFKIYELSLIHIWRCRRRG